MKKIALLLAFAASPAFAQDPDPVYQMIEGIGFCVLGEGKADTTVAQLGTYNWTSAAGEAGTTTFAPPAGPTSGVVSDAVGFCQVDSSGLGTGDAEMAFSLFMMGGNSGVEVTEEGTNAEGCATRTLSNGAVATLTSGGEAPTCESDTTASWRLEFPAQ